MALAATTILNQLAFVELGMRFGGDRLTEGYPPLPPKHHPTPLIKLIGCCAGGTLWADDLPIGFEWLDRLATTTHSRSTMQQL